MLSGKQPERIFLIRAASESGKSVLLAELAKHAASKFGAGGCARINLRGEPPLAMVLDRICIDLGRDSFPKFCSGGIAVPIQIHAELQGAKFRDENAVTVAPHIHQAGVPSSTMMAANLIADLSLRGKPCVVIIDTFEQATVETSNWIVQQLLPTARSVPGLWIIIGGQAVPEAIDYPLEWGDLAKSHELSPVTSVDDWHEYACQEYPNFPRHDIEVLCKGLTSSPSAIAQFIRAVGLTLGGSHNEALS
jgi:hypothetical protein